MIVLCVKIVDTMRFDIITIFPEFFGGPLDYGIVRRAREGRLIETAIHDLRNFTHDRHRTVDDRPFGGGEGMVLKPEPIFKAVEAVLGCGHLEVPSGAAPANDATLSLGSANATGSSATPQSADRTNTIAPNSAIVLLSASGRLFRQETARRFAKLERIVLLCGRYEGVDERVAEHLATDEISIGDFVLSGGELGAALIVDAVARLIPGALGNEDSALNESFSEFRPAETARLSASTVASDSGAPVGSSAVIAPELPVITSAANATGTHDPLDYERLIESGMAGHGILDYPHYTRPPSFRGWDVPEVLLGGNHEEIRRWRRQKAIEKTLRNRPDLLAWVKPGKSGQ